jgi:mono/diheme cytochrome c family protein
MRKELMMRCEGLACSLMVLVAGLGLAGTAQTAEPFEAFLEAHCLKCHGPDKEKGDLRLDKLSRDFKQGEDAQRWREVLEAINAGDMPPKKEKRPTREEITGFISTLDERIKIGRDVRMAARPAVSLYRLSRKEYQNTVYDLLGVRYDPAKPGELNADTRWHGFERIGSQLTLSPSHVDRYYRAADLVLERAFPSTASEARKVRKTAAELRYDGGKDQQALLDRFGIKHPLRFLLYPGSVEKALAPNWFDQTGPARSGLFRVRLQASGIRPPGGQTAHLSIGRRTGEETVDGLVEFDLTAPEDKPQVYEFEVFLEMPATLEFCVVSTHEIDRRAGAAFRYALGKRNGYIFTHSSETLLLNANAPQMFDDKGNGLFSTVLLDWIEWEGPLVSDAEKSRRSGVLPPDDASPGVVAQHLQRFAERAWRRPVKPEELADFLKSYGDERAAGESVVDAYRVALQGVLTSQHFIYIVEGDPVKRDTLTQVELATRLSYLLWSSMPDDALAAAANAGALAGDGLAKAVDRMVSDSKISRFVDDFPRQWLQLHRVGMFLPDKKLYPSYDPWLQTSMAAEPVEFFREVFSRNLPIDSFIDSDWTMANARLCEFYGFPEPSSGGFERVALKPEDHRGGLLTMGASLGLTSDGTRHRPVHRGVWLSEAMYNRTPPPPPANVDPIEPVPPKSPKVTVRQRLDVHAQNANCAACHRGIDPFGFAFEQYDAIGQWRLREVVGSGTGDDPLVDPAAAMPDGRPFADARAFKQRLLEDRDKIARAFIEQVCSYGLRRVLTVDDADDVQAIVAIAKQSGYRLKDLVRAVALSSLMRKR